MIIPPILFSVLEGISISTYKYTTSLWVKQGKLSKLTKFFSAFGKGWIPVGVLSDVNYFTIFFLQRVASWGFVERG
jgi:hypothetical protein